MFSIICILYYHRTSSKISKRMLPCCAKLIQLCPTLCNPLDCSPLGSSVHGILRQEYWSELPCPPPGDLPNLGTEPLSLMSPALAGGFFTTSATWEEEDVGTLLWSSRFCFDFPYLSTDVLFTFWDPIRAATVHLLSCLQPPLVWDSLSVFPGFPWPWWSWGVRHPAECPSVQVFLMFLSGSDWAYHIVSLWEFIEKICKALSTLFGRYLSLSLCIFKCTELWSRKETLQPRAWV